MFSLILTPIKVTLLTVIALSHIPKCTCSLMICDTWPTPLQCHTSLPPHYHLILIPKKFTLLSWVVLFTVWSVVLCYQFPVPAHAIFITSFWCLLYSGSLARMQRTPSVTLCWLTGASYCWMHYTGFEWGIYSCNVCTYVSVTLRNVNLHSFALTCMLRNSCVMCTDDGGRGKRRTVLLDNGGCGGQCLWSS